MARQNSIPFWSREDFFHGDKTAVLSRDGGNPHAAKVAA